MQSEWVLKIPAAREKNHLWNFVKTLMNMYSVMTVRFT